MTASKVGFSCPMPKGAEREMKRPTGIASIRSDVIGDNNAGAFEVGTARTSG